MKAQEAYYQAYEAQKRIPELEPIILQSVRYAYGYAENVIKGRWLEAEEIIINNAEWSQEYARQIIKGRWPEAESCIMQDAKYAYWYARNVIQGRWPEAEEVIAKSKWKDEYIYWFFDESVFDKETIGEFIWNQKNISGYFAPASLFENKVSLLDVMVKE